MSHDGDVLPQGRRRRIGDLLQPATAMEGQYLQAALQGAGYLHAPLLLPQHRVQVPMETLSLHFLRDIVDVSRHCRCASWCSLKNLTCQSKQRESHSATITKVSDWSFEMVS